MQETISAWEFFAVPVVAAIIVSAISNICYRFLRFLKKIL